jgi:hypothetical protein
MTKKVLSWKCSVFSERRSADRLKAGLRALRSLRCFAAISFVEGFCDFGDGSGVVAQAVGDAALDKGGSFLMARGGDGGVRRVPSDKFAYRLRSGAFQFCRASCPAARADSTVPPFPPSPGYGATSPPSPSCGATRR